MSDSETKTAHVDGEAPETCGEFLLRAEMDAPVERVFQALASEEVCRWWVRPGVFDTRYWRGDVQPSGGWEAGGVGKGKEYQLRGEFLEVRAPNRLVHSWQPASLPSSRTVVTYELEERGSASRLTLHHAGFGSPEACSATRSGWEASLAHLSQLLAAERSGA